MCTDNFDPCFPDQPVVDLYLPIWASLPAFRSKPAFIWAEDGSSPRRSSAVTYGQLNASADLIASQLLGRLQLRRGDSVVIISSPGPGLDIVKLLFSCQRAGLVCVPVSQPAEASARLDHLIRVFLQTKPKAVIAHKASAHSIRTHLITSRQLVMMMKPVRWLFLEDFQLEYYSREADMSSAGDCCNFSAFPSSPSSYYGCGPRDVYVVQYTSGATGIPKPVLVTAGSAAHNVREARKSYQLQPSSVIVSWLPQFHDCGLMFLLLTVVSGATSVLTSPSSFVNRPRLWLELVTEFRATCTPVPSFALPLVVRRGGARHQLAGTTHVPLDLGSLRNLVVINEPIYRDLIVQFVDEFACVGLLPSCISPSYGLAENCTFVSTAWRSSLNLQQQSNLSITFPSHDGLLPSARLASSTINNDVEEAEAEAEEIEIVVVDANTCEPVEDGVEGEIWVSSPSNASGYLGYPSLSQQVFMGRLRGTVSRRFVRTGDRGVVKGEEADCRYLFVTGRASDIIEIRGSSSTHQNHVWHPHYLEKVAYESSSGSLRGGCVAAFELFSRVVVVVAELQKGHDDDDDDDDEDDDKVGGGAGWVPLYESICRSINGALVKHILELDQVMRLVILVRSGSLPKTTSGKMQRWAARAKLMRGEMANIVEAALVGPASLPLLGLNNINPTTKGKLLVKALLSLPNDHSTGSDILQEPHCHLLSQLMSSL